ncbi:DEAD/DEAH box helicase [Corallococcus sp. CA047B]|uniref:protein DpdJ n=1 Tax=Corallococcus sp. CA047B TaxID=2316729 RepID=UPI000EA09038|nr:protein DpdJ [Corallococcus sp. CA047B]RKH18569.1 DEAD/DEAH box helicase [Corallococcus sp. CA047B]
MSLDEAQRQGLDFLGEIERAEAALLSWGIVDGFFSQEELQDRASRFLDRMDSHAFEDPQGLLDWLENERLLWLVHGEDGRYRTRMAETLRLLARLRQIFADKPKNPAARWRTGKNLVADFRLLLRPRLFPKRRFTAQDVLTALQGTGLDARQVAVVKALLRVNSKKPLELAQFQLTATRDILSQRVSSKRSFGTIVCAGTGSGKTLAFYLPAFISMARWLGGPPWTKCLALYPRNELLKDQLREALGQAKRVNEELPTGVRLSIGVLYGDVPKVAKDLLDRSSQRAKHFDAWEKVGDKALRCPLLDCPSCNRRLLWRLDDIQTGLERLSCESKSCGLKVSPDEIRLTRDSLSRSPPDLLFTTTEMVNQRMATSMGKLFGFKQLEHHRPRLVLLDEVHTYEGVHGAQVALLLRRWQKLTQARPHFVGLSATLADAERFFADLTGVRRTDVIAVIPDDSEMEPEGMEYQVALRGDPVSGASLLSTSIQTLMLMRRMLEPNGISRPAYGKKVFAFTDNLDVNNRLFFDTLDAEGWKRPGTPDPRKPWGSLATLRAREHADHGARLVQGQSWVVAEWIGHALTGGARAAVDRVSSLDRGINRSAEIVVATSSLEVGFDDPEVGAVVQHKAPRSGASFLQRKGRAGRRREMRPWTLVALTDFGRDRLAYQAYEQIFSPVLAPRYLPIGNRHVLKMQATYTLLDWVAAVTSAGSSTPMDAWLILSTPADQRYPNQLQRQKEAIELLRRVLENPAERARFTRYLQEALGLDESTLQAVLWEPPRALLTSVIPTCLRRLERNWKIATSGKTEAQEPSTPRTPLPEFIPRALFGDLNVPEVQVVLNNAFRRREEWMPVAQALREFAPGRVSHRFSIQHQNQRNWVRLPEVGDTLWLEDFCNPEYATEIGRFDVPWSEHKQPFAVIRPLQMNTVEPPEEILSTSNAFPVWSTTLRTTAEGYRLSLPRGSRWRKLIDALWIHTYALSQPVELIRFTPEVNVSLKMKGGEVSERVVSFKRREGEDGNEPVALGFNADIDALAIDPKLPESLAAQCTSDPGLLRALRPALFRQRLQDDSRLDGIANRFQRDWLADACFSALALEALGAGIPLEEAWSRIRTDDKALTQVLDILFMALPATEDGGEDAEGEVDRGRRHQELLELLDSPTVVTVLGEAATVLWSAPDASWEPWLRRRVRSTLGTACLEAIHILCSQINAEDLLLDLDAVGTGPGDRLWLTEAALGGAAIIEYFLSRYGDDPRRFFGLLDSVLAPSDFEEIDFQLRALLSRLCAPDVDRDEALVNAVAAIRQSGAHEDWVEHSNHLRRLLSDRGFLVNQQFVAALFARLLRPGSSPAMDAMLARLLGAWDAAEARLGVELAPQIVALWESKNEALDSTLTRAGEVPGGERRGWRYSTLLGLLWPRGSGVRAESLKTSNPYTSLPTSDRLLIEVLLPQQDIEVRLEETDWLTILTDRLITHGHARLSAPETDLRELREAMLAMLIEPLDIGALLVHPRVRGTRRQSGRVAVTFDLLEAVQ